MQADWDKINRALRVTVPPYAWLFGEDAGRDKDEDDEEEKKLGEDGQPVLENKSSLVSEQVNVSLTFNNQEWIEALPFHYHDAKLARLAYVHNFGEHLVEEEEKQTKWLEEEPEEPIPEELTEEELKKRDEEKAKKAAEETEEVHTMAKRKGYKMYLYGENFLKTSGLQVMFTFDNGAKTSMVTPIYKNPKMLAFCVPDMGVEVPVGTHPLSVELTLNG